MEGGGREGWNEGGMEGGGREGWNEGGMEGRMEEGGDRVREVWRDGGVREEGGR